MFAHFTWLCYASWLQKKVKHINISLEYLICHKYMPTYFPTYFWTSSHTWGSLIHIPQLIFSFLLLLHFFWTQIMQTLCPLLFHGFWLLLTKSCLEDISCHYLCLCIACLPFFRFSSILAVGLSPGVDGTPLVYRPLLNQIFCIENFK